MGKTQICLQLAYMIEEDDAQSSVFWLPAFSNSAYDRACKSLVKELHLSRNDGEDSKELFRQYLNSHDIGRWLLILDNADSEEVIFGDESVSGLFSYLPQRRKGQILLTTRSKMIATQFAKKNILSVEEMMHEDARVLLQSSLEHEELAEDNSEVDKLLSELTYLPLAISQAVAYINATDITIAEYLKEWKRSYRSIMRMMRSWDKTLDEEQKRCAVATTWLISYNQLQKQSPAAVKLIHFIMWIEPHAVPLTILPEVGAEERDVAVGVLKSYQFLRERSIPEVFDVHTLTHAAMQFWAEDQRLDVDDKADVLHHLAKISGTVNWDEQEIWRAHLPHVLHVFKSYKEINPGIITQLGTWVADCLMMDSQTSKGFSIINETYSVKTLRQGMDHIDWSSSAYSHADVSAAIDQIQDTLAVLGLDTSSIINATSENDGNSQATQAGLADINRSDMQLEESIELLGSSVKTKEMTLSTDKLSQFRQQHCLAAIYQANGQNEEAIALLEHNIKIWRERLKEDHPDLLSSQQSLAKAYLEIGEAAQAVAMLRGVMNIREAKLDDTHPEMLATLSLMARAYDANNEIDGNIEMLEKIVDFHAKTLDNAHPERLLSQLQLAQAYKRNAQFEKYAAVLTDNASIMEFVEKGEDQMELDLTQHFLLKEMRIFEQAQNATSSLSALSKVMNVLSQALESPPINSESAIDEHATLATDGISNMARDGVEIQATSSSHRTRRRAGGRRKGGRKRKRT